MSADAPTDARVVGVPEQSDGALIPDAQLLPGHVFGISMAYSRIRRTSSFPMFPSGNSSFARPLKVLRTAIC